MKQDRIHNRSSSGIALAITLVVLVVLSITTTILAVRVAAVRKRHQYMIDYQKARYGLDSAMKYAFAVLPDKTLTLVERGDAPDFSDLFWLNKEQYLTYVSAWAEQAAPEQLEKYLKEKEEDSDDLSETDTGSLISNFISKMMGTDPNSTEDADPNEPVEYLDPNQIVVPGPYGPQWPNVIEPIDLDIGDCKVTIAVEDENAKMPLSWAITSNLNSNKQAQAALQTFAEWMSMDEKTLKTLIEELNNLGKYKRFELNPSQVLLTQMGQVNSVPQTQNRTAGRRTQTQPNTTVQQQIVSQQARPAVGHAADFAKLFHSSLLNSEPLSVPLPEMAFDDESPMKYLAIWGSQRINVNTAPRQVLEAAFSFGGNAVEIADRIIRTRKEKPIATMQKLKDALYGDLDSIERAGQYLDTKSNFVTVKITCCCGSARVSAIAAAIKENKQVERLIILYGR